MISEVVMPQMGADMTEGTLLRWIKHEGDQVERGEIIAEIETDKANVEIEAFEGGVFRKTLAAEGDVIPVGDVIAVIAGAGDDISRYANGAKAAASTAAPPVAPPTPAAAQPAASAADQQSASATAYDERPPVPAPPAPVPRPAPAASPIATGARTRISPVARRFAEDRGIDIGTLQGSGPDGRIIRRDVEAAVAATPAPRAASLQRTAPATGDTTSIAGQSKMRQAIARRMSQSKREAPHYYLLERIDMTDAVAFRAQINQTVPEADRISINDMIVRACGLALATHDGLNVTLEGDAITKHSVQNVCIAIALDDGLIAPALLDVGSKSLVEIAANSKDLVERSKRGSLRADELTAGTFTITNLGAYGIETLIGIIQPPQTAILGVGSAIDQPAVHDGAIAIRTVMEVALSADHRTTDGAYGARFLAEVKRLLEHPLLLVL